MSCGRTAVDTKNWKRSYIDTNFTNFTFWMTSSKNYIRRQQLYYDWHRRLISFICMYFYPEIANNTQKTKCFDLLPYLWTVVLAVSHPYIFTEDTNKLHHTPFDDIIKFRFSSMSRFFKLVKRNRSKFHFDSHKIES